MPLWHQLMNQKPLFSHKWTTQAYTFGIHVRYGMKRAEGRKGRVERAEGRKGNFLPSPSDQFMTGNPDQ
jgi:hypothetical protein